MSQQKEKDAGEAGLGQVAVFMGSEWAWLTRSESSSGLKKVRQLTYLSAESKLWVDVAVRTKATWRYRV